jgi:hypothetical protein
LIVPIVENQLTPTSDHGRMNPRMFQPKGSTPMTTYAYAAKANGPAGDARMRAFGSCPASPAVSLWSPIILGITPEHGRPRRQEVSHL